MGFVFVVMCGFILIIIVFASVESTVDPSVRCLNPLILHGLRTVCI